MEIWKDIEGYEGLYQVSNLGRVKSLGNGNSNKSKNKTLKQQLSHKGYPMIGLCKNGKPKRFSVHRLVAEAFLPNPNNYDQVNHKDENKTNNCISNLEWCTPQYNVNYGTRTDKTSKSVLQFSLNGDFIRKWKSIRGIEQEEGFNNANIQKCCNNKYKTAYGYKWGYEEDYEQIPFKVFDLKIYKKVS